MNLDQKSWFTSVYKQLASIGIDGKTEMPDLVPPIEDKTELYSEVRRECAYNFPAMVIFVGPSNFVETLYPTFAGLAADPTAKVRKTLASSLHELANRVESSFNTTKVQIVRLFNGKKIPTINFIYFLKSLCRKISIKYSSLGYILLST